MDFNKFNLDNRLLTTITNAGYSTPTPIQTAAIPVILEGKDLIGTAQTGTGKTAAFVLPLLQKLLAEKSNNVRALIVTPTRELAGQIHDSIRELSKGTPIRSTTIYGGVSAVAQIRALKSRVDILVACPGRLLDLIDQGYINLGFINTLILDEADRMLDMGFMPPLRQILKLVPKQRQTLLFSATFPPEINKLASEALTNPQRINIGLSRPAYTVNHAFYPVVHQLKTPLLLALLGQTKADSVLIFTKTRSRARRLAQQIDRIGLSVTSLHSDRTQAQRQSALDGFKQGRYQIMVATDIAARGLDVASVSHVINFDMPDTPDAYIHRIGRTGRAERSGDAFTFTTNEDHVMVQSIERIMGSRIKREMLSGFDYKAQVSSEAVFSNKSKSTGRQSARSPRYAKSY